MVRSGFDRPNLSFDVVQLEGKGSKARKLALLEARPRATPANRPAIVYCGTRKDTDEVAAVAARGGPARRSPTTPGMDPDERAAAQRRFMAGEAEVIVATNAFGMGVDKADVRSVWHWRSRPASRPTTRRPAARAATACPPAPCCSRCSSDLGRLVRFIQKREVEPESVSLYAQRLKAGSDGDGNLTIDAPRVDEDRVQLAIAERAGAFEVEPAPGGRLELRFSDRIDMAAAASRLQGGQGPRLARLPRDRVVQLRRELPAPEAARPLRRLDARRARGPLLRRLRSGVVAAVTRGARGEGEAPELRGPPLPRPISRPRTRSCSRRSGPGG